MPALRLAQEAHGWLPPEALREVAEALDLTPAYCKAVASFYAAIRLNPENFKAHDSLGLCFQNLANYSLAEHYYKRALEIAEKHHQTYTCLASAENGESYR